jgi:uncharacterized tellurite resistance protein B-like protein
MLEQIVHWLAYGSLAFGGVAAYLQLNKLWARKHLEEVAASISIPGVLFEGVPALIFFAYFLVRGDAVGVIDSAIWLVAAVGFIMIGSGLWVKGQRSAGFWRLVLRSIHSERHELGTLAQSLLHTASRKELVRLLQKIAEVDGEISENEARFVNEFATKLGLESRVEASAVTGTRADRLLGIRTALQDYLRASPPVHQVEQLEHLLHHMVRADGSEHADENSALVEVKGMLKEHLASEEAEPPFRVLLAPQDEEQAARVIGLLQESRFHDSAGGRGITVGGYYSRDYADTVCKDFRDLGFFCVVTDEAL